MTKLIPYAGLLCVLPLGASAAFTVFTDRAAFLEAVAELDTIQSVVEENFSDPELIPEIASIDSDFSRAGVSFGSWYDRVDLDPLNEITINLALETVAFGADFNSIDVIGPGTGVDIFVDGEFVATSSRFSDWDFVGFISDTPFDSVVFKAGSGFSATFQDTFRFDNLALGLSEVIPEPNTLSLLGLGLGALLIARRRRS